MGEIILATRNLSATAAPIAVQPGVVISVIIPVLNEAAQIGAALRRTPRTEDFEVIVVDGGSTDETAAIAEAYGVRVIHTAAGRARQMNAGAAVARGDILLFLHADTRLPADFAHVVRKTLAGPGVILGAFRLRIDSPLWGFRIIEALANFRSAFWKMPYGDQAFFLRARHFRMAGGFSNLPIMEDFEFVRRLRRWGRIAVAPAAVLTSARRWEQLGVLRATLLNQAIILAYLFGVPPARLARWYRSGTLALRNISRETGTRKRLVAMARTFPSTREH
jgi:rSAM/selenodomain-associated transferase 2